MHELNCLHSIGVDVNIGNMVNFYLFEKLCGFIHNHVEVDEPHFLINSHITDNEKSIIWGSGLQNNSESVPFSNHITKISNPVVRFKNIYCVRGPLTKTILEKQHNICISHFG